MSREPDSWTFVNVDPTVPKKRRKKRRIVSPIVRLSSPCDSAACDSAELDDFDRFLLLSTDASFDWAELFGEASYPPWTPLATSAMQSALFDFCAFCHQAR